MKNSIIIALSVLSLSVWICEGLSQEAAKDLTSQFEKGDISELQHKQRVFVVADRPIQADNIIKAMKKYPGIQVVSSAADVEYVIAYTVERKKYRVSISVQ
ncbi:MAG: hypothetical protein M3539_01040, partial [Acidobacteriota bacterium]|nr:hypothetical protein [Acidobacteriota bacterium]